MAFGNEEFDYLEKEEKSLEDSQENLPSIEPIKKEEPEQTEVVAEEKEEIKEEPKEEKEEQEEPSNTHIYTVKVTTNKEQKALELVADKIKKKSLNVHTVSHPHGLRGYIFLEAPDRENAEEAVFNLPYVKGIIPQIITYDEIKPMLEPVTADMKIEKDDIVEMIAEPFKKEKAKVVRIDKARGEAVVSLLGAVVPIPVTVKLDNVRVIQREDGEEIDGL